MTFSDTWQDANPDGGDNEPPEPGVYDVALIDADAFTSKAGDDWAKLELQDVATKYEWTLLLGFKNPKQAGFSKGVCQTVGVDVDSVSSLEELGSALKTHVGSYYSVKVEQNGDYRNTYINGPADEGPKAEVPADTEGLEPAAAASGDESVPF